MKIWYPYCDRHKSREHFAVPFLYINVLNIKMVSGMTDDIPDVPAMVGQIYEDPEKEKTRGTVF